MPKVSLITINLNNSAGLDKTIHSVMSQTYTDFEYIVIDGGSVDGSVEVIKKNKRKITYWVSEKDKGIYNAMNKGILKAEGEYCLFINSGDFFIKSTILENMSDYINGEDILYGNGFFEAKQNTLNKLECPEKLTLGFFILYSLFHPATLIKKKLFFEYGFYNESNKIVSDWEFFIKTIIINNVETKLIPLDVAIAEDNGISRKIDYTIILEDERRKVLDSFFPGYVIDLMDDYKDLKHDNMKLEYVKNKVFSEISLYKSNMFFRAILKMMRIFVRNMHN